jgi:hypothetical protein
VAEAVVVVEGHFLVEMELLEQTHKVVVAMVVRVKVLKVVMV